MTKREAVIVSAYTGVLICDFGDLQKYIEDLAGGLIFTHELPAACEMYKKRIEGDLKAAIIDADVSTPDELAKTMRDLSTIDDQEERHIKMDSAMVHVLKELGYTEAMEIFSETDKWYA